MSDDDCGCCDGVGIEAPDPRDNPPGLTALSYRVGTHRSFLRTMMARLSSTLAGEGATDDDELAHRVTSCHEERHRSFLLGGEPDAGTALLDGWACIADVLTFYQERIANEGYLRTATEQRSVIELGRLTGYEPRPGVAASVHLAFAVQDGFDGAIPARTRTQSLPRPEQKAQTFETSEITSARAEWNAMRAAGRATGRYIRREYVAIQPEVTYNGLEQGKLLLQAVPTNRIEIFLDGVGQNVQVGDVLVVAPRDAGKLEASNVYRATAVTPDAGRGHTTVRLVPFSDEWHRGGEWDVVVPERKRVARLEAEPAASGPASDLDELDVERRRKLGRAVEPAPAPVVLVMRTKTQVFGHGVPQNIEITIPPQGTGGTSTSTPKEHAPADDERADVLYLAGEHPAIRAHSLVVMRTPPEDDPSGGLTTRVLTATAVDVQSRLAYGSPGKTTWLQLSETWWNPDRDGAHAPRVATDIKPIRRTLVYAQPEPLVVVGEPLSHPVEGETIALDGLVGDLPPGRLLIVEGEVFEPGVSGVRATELVRVAGTTTAYEDPPLSRRLYAPWLKDVKAIEFTPLEPAMRARAYTVVALTRALTNRYVRGTVVIRGNIAHATHGETRDEVLGSGDAAVPEQHFILRQGPRTWEPAPTPSGIASSLSVRVSGVLWPEVPSYALLGPRDEVVRNRTLGDRRDELRGGDGHRGARFPTGVENLTARYRVGLGVDGNVDGGLITQLVTRPMGVREVINPQAASGGADPDGRDEIRERIPIAARGIDRLVSVADHADFALNFAGIGKSAARLVPAVADLGGGGATIEVVIAGDEGVTIAADSDLLRNLRLAFRRYGDPLLRAKVRVAGAVALRLIAGVRVDPRHEWSRVEAALRERLYQRHGWDARAIGEAARLSVVLEALQGVEGVLSIDVDLFEPRAATSPSTGRRWSIAAGVHEILYFSRSTPDDVSFLEVTS